jgi:hypothetical protein
VSYPAQDVIVFQIEHQLLLAAYLLTNITISVVEKHPSGYPLYASFLARHSEFQHFRRFRKTRMHMLLLKQDVISKLEKQLNKIRPGRGGRAIPR